MADVYTFITHYEVEAEDAVEAAQKLELHILVGIEQYYKDVLVMSSDEKDALGPAFEHGRDLFKSMVKLQNYIKDTSGEYYLPSIDFMRQKK